MIVQCLPDAPERMHLPDLHGGDGDESLVDHADDDAWAEARSLLETVDTAELTVPLVGTERLLYRLFHERGARVYAH